MPGGPERCYQFRPRPTGPGAPDAQWPQRPGPVSGWPTGAPLLLRLGLWLVCGPQWALGGVRVCALGEPPSVAWAHSAPPLRHRPEPSGSWTFQAVSPGFWAHRSCSEPCAVTTLLLARGPWHPPSGWILARVLGACSGNVDCPIRAHPYRQLCAWALEPLSTQTCLSWREMLSMGPR